MKNLVFVLCLFFVCSVFCFSAETENKKAENMVFGISQSDYEALNLSKDQIKKIENLKKDYDKSNAESEKKKADTPTDTEKLSKDFEGYIKKQNKLYDDFKKILTKEQHDKYERAYLIKLSEQKVFLLRKFSAFEEPLSLNDEQKKSYRKLINNYEGDLIALEQDFIKILSEKQKIVYNHLKKRQMEALIASGKNVQNEKKENSQNVSQKDTSSQNSGSENKTFVVQPVIWWSFSNWNPWPVYRREVHIYHHYWDVYDREWREWDYNRWAYEEWKYEEKIYRKGFIDGIEYDRRLYEKWAEDPYDEKTDDYFEKKYEDYEYNAYSDIYKGADVGYNLSKYYNEKNSDWDYSSYCKDYKIEDYDWSKSEYDKNYDYSKDFDYDFGADSDPNYGGDYNYGSDSDISYDYGGDYNYDWGYDDYGW